MATKKTAPKKPVKAAPAKKAAASPKKTVATKKAATPKKAAAPAKKAAPAPKKAAPAKKAVAVKAVVALKKAAPAKKVAEAPKKAAPAKVVVAPKKAAPAPKAPVAPAPKKITPAPVAKSAPVAEDRQSSKSSAAAEPASRKAESKQPAPIIAHRKKEKPSAKITAPSTTMKEYNPHTRSLLDMPEQSTGPVYRYSDEELNEFKELILKRLDTARENFAYYQNLITRKDEAGDDADNKLNSMEDGSGAMEKEQLSLMAARQIQFINNLEKALVRIENKTYGICRETGKLIDKARLRAVPHATLSIEAKNSMKK